MAVPAVDPAPSMTVGEFLLLYAKSAQMVLPDSASPETALAALKAANALPDMELRLDRVVTHNDVVRIGQAAGLKITTRTPERTIDRQEVELFLAAFGPYLSAGSAPADRLAASDNPPGDPANNARTDKGKKKGRPFQSPTTPP